MSRSRRHNPDDELDACSLPELDTEAEYQWWEIPAQMYDHEVVLRFYEPANTSITELMRRVQTRRNMGAFIVDDGETLRLQFGLRYIQSQMNLLDPDALALGYTRTMMAGLLLQPAPEHVVIVGLGGGSMSRFCYQKLPQTRVTSIEIDRKVIAMAREFDLPAEDERMRIIHADAAEVFARGQLRADLVLVDGCSREGLVEGLIDDRFFANVRSALSQDGVVVVNLVGNRVRCDLALSALRRVFDGQLLSLNVTGERNRILLASASPQWPPAAAALEARAMQLGEQLGLPMADYAQRLIMQTAA